MAVGVEAPVGNDTLAEGMERTDVHLREVVRRTRVGRDQAEEGAQAFVQLERSLLGECGEHDLLGLDPVEDHEVQGAPEEHPGLA